MKGRVQLEDVFVDFDPARIVFDDEGLLVVDKPVGVPSQAADPEVEDDLPARLRRYLARTGKPTYLGIHQRLDAETSGLILFVRDRAHNPAIAAQFEGRRVEKTYVAGVTGWPPHARARELTLHHRLAEDERGRMRPVARGGKEARTRVRLIERVGDRALLELSLETGRMHQARAQLAANGTPIAGDRLYDGEPASRLMLHAMALSLRAASGRPVRVRSKPPSELYDWLAHGDAGERIYDEPQALESGLRRALERRWGLARAMPAGRETNVFRLANEEGDGLPGLGLDYYAGFVVANVYGGLAESLARRDRALDAIAALGFDGVYLKTRPKHASRLGEAEREKLAPPSPVRGLMAADPLAVVEEGTPYLVRLGDGLATGFYPDQRANRRRICAAAKGKTLLNLFSYTCAFSIAAARAGAARTTNVDASATALERGRSGFAHAALDPDAHEFVAMDAHGFLERAARKGQRWDLVVLDPPSYGTAKSGRFTVSSDFERLAAAAIRVLSGGGAMLASINHRQTSAARFRHVLLDAGRAAGRSMKARNLPPPLDFPAWGESHLKAIWVQV